MNVIQKDEWDKLTPNEQWQYVQVVDGMLHDRQRLLEILPCPVHGECVPYAVSEVKRLKALAQ
jgi:hypothetical protein